MAGLGGGGAGWLRVTLHMLRQFANTLVAMHMGEFGMVSRRPSDRLTYCDFCLILLCGAVSRRTTV